MSSRLKKFLEKTRGYRLSEEERQAQRIDFAYSNAKIENPRVPLESVVEAAEQMRRSPHGDAKRP